MKILYTAIATASGDGRNGHVASEDGILDLDVRFPVEMGGPGGATNPEQLFAAGYAACFHSALRHVGAAEKADIEGSTVTANVSIGTAETGGFGLAVQLNIHAPDLEHSACMALVEKAHKVCPYSNATRGNVNVTLNVV